MIKGGFPKQKLNPNLMEMSLKIHRISDLQKIVGTRQHLDSNSVTSLFCSVTGGCAGSVQVEALNQGPGG